MPMTLQQAFEAAFAHERAGRNAAARAIYTQILAAIPGHPGALLKIAEHELDAGLPEAARARLETALPGASAQGMPTQPIWHALARAHVARGDRAAARHACERALELVPDALPTLRLLAGLLLEGGDAPAAQTVCRRGLFRHPRDVGLMHLLGKALKSAGATKEARSVLAECAAESGNDPAVLMTLGAVCLDAGDVSAAAGYLERVVAADARNARAWDNLGLAYRVLGDHERAQDAFERAVVADPALTPALANLVQERHRLCAWEGIGDLKRRLIATLDTPGSDPRWSPHIALNCGLTAAQELSVARRWSRAVLPAPVVPGPLRPRGDRLRVGYLSSDLREHPTGRLMAGLFEAHDRSRCEIFAYSYGDDDGSALHARIRAAFGPAWRDVRGVPDAEVAQTIRADGIDVLIDRKGHTRGNRLAILAYRPAPVQLHYMSFPGTLGYDAIDGLIADDEVIPPHDERHYHERVWRLPRSYYVNDGARALPPPATRADAGLPEGALVLACLNMSYKLSPAVFAIWMDALARAPDAVLWLLASGLRPTANLRAQAERAGVDPARLLFAPPLPQDVHIARLRCADLMLDTLPVGSHTTACDALWGGVPLLTCRGETFASRVGASILRTAGLPDLITNSLEDYRNRLLELVSERSQLRQFRAYLERTRHDNPLFDTRGFARDWEALLERAYDGTVAARSSSAASI